MAGPVKSDVQLPELTAAQKKQLSKLETELRCLVCQNQTLAESTSEMAGDLRNRVHLLVAEGKSDDEIKTYLADRFTDFVLYKPPVKKTTALLWAGPFALLGIGAGAWFVINRRQARLGNNPVNSPTNSPVSESDSSSEAAQTAKERARSLLDEKPR